MFPAERNAPSSLEDAAAQLRSGMGSARRGRCSLPELREAERRVLKTWLFGQGRCLDQDPTLNLDRRQAHGEHSVAFDPQRSCWWKTTHPGTCGVGAEFHYDQLPPFHVTGVSARELLPSEYVARLLLHNIEFGDDIRLEAYVDGPAPSLVISQPDVIGAPASAQQMTDQMQALGYKPLHKLHVGKPESISFYHPESRIAMFDAHPGNFFQSHSMTLPIDGILLKIEAEAEHLWLMSHIH